MKTEQLIMDNRDYPRYPPEIVVMGEWLNTLAHMVIQGRDVRQKRHCE